MNIVVVPDSLGKSDSIAVTDVQPRSRSTSSSRSKSNLPRGIGAPNETTCSDIFVPTFLKYVGSLREPWHPDATQSIAALQIIWDVVYHDRLYTILKKADPVHNFVRLIFIHSDPTLHRSAAPTEDL